MFKVVENTFADSMRMVAAPGVRFEPGLIAQTRELDGVIVCDVSDGTRPLGIVSNSIFNDSDKINFNEKYMVEVWPQRMVFRTNNYEIGDYRTGDLLYVSLNGLLTIICPFEDAPAVGRIISGPKKLGEEFEALWL